MAKRKFGASIIILCIAAITLISGTYAWFLVGGFAELFDIGFDIMEAGGGLWVQGDMATYGGGKTDNGGWGANLERSDFRTLSFIAEGGRYKPISSTNGTDFIYVTMENDKFYCQGAAPTKKSLGVTAEDICFNDFTFFIKSTGEEIPAGAYMTIELKGKRYDAEGNLVDETLGAATAARVAVTLKVEPTGSEETKIYSFDGADDKAVTSIFTKGTITDAKNPNQNYIIDEADPGYADAGLVPVDSTSLVNEDTTLYHIPLGNIPNVDSSGKQITIRIWLEGNDPQCISFGEGAIAGKNLSAHIEFHADM